MKRIDVAIGARLSGLGLLALMISACEPVAPTGVAQTRVPIAPVALVLLPEELDAPGGRPVAVAELPQYLKMICLDNLPDFAGSEAAMHQTGEYVRATVRPGMIFHKRKNMTIRLSGGRDPGCQISFYTSNSPEREEAALAALVAATNASLSRGHVEILPPPIPGYLEIKVTQN